MGLMPVTSPPGATNSMPLSPDSPLLSPRTPLAGRRQFPRESLARSETSRSCCEIFEEASGNARAASKKLARWSYTAPLVDAAASGTAVLSAFISNKAASFTFGAASSILWPAGVIAALFQYDMESDADSEPYKLLARAAHYCNMLAGFAAGANFCAPEGSQLNKDSGDFSDMTWLLGSGVGAAKSTLDAGMHLSELLRRRDRHSMFQVGADVCSTASCVFNALAALMSMQARAASLATNEQTSQGAAQRQLFAQIAWLVGSEFAVFGTQLSELAKSGSISAPEPEPESFC